MTGAKIREIDISYMVVRHYNDDTKASLYVNARFCETESG